MKRFAYCCIVAILMLTAVTAYSGELRLLGVACRSNWISDIYMTGDASDYLGQQMMQVSYYAAEQPGWVWTLEYPIQGGGYDWNVNFNDFICELFGPLGATSGFVRINVPWDVMGYAITKSGDFGSKVPAAVAADRAGNYRVPNIDTTEYRVNALFFLDGDAAAVIDVGATEVRLPARETVVILDLAPGTIIATRSPGLNSPLYITFSQVNNNSNDPVNIQHFEWLMP